MQMMKVNDLIPHPRNTEFFDDMSGEKWNEFLKSIDSSGVIEPIIVTQDKVIVSGHQRIKACKELRIEEVAVEMRNYDSEDSVLKDLIETNIRQRGDVGGSYIKLGRRVKEMERIYGVRQGSTNEKGVNVGASAANGGSRNVTQQDIANKYNVSVDTIQRAKKLADLPQYLQDLVEEGRISPSVASRLIAKLNSEEQEQLAEYLSRLPVAEKITQKKMQSYIDIIREKDNQIAGYEMRLKQVERDKESLREELKQERQKEPETIIKEVVPDDYDMYRKNNEWLNKEYQKRCAENTELKNELHALREDSARENLRERLENDCIFFCARCDDFLKGVGGYAYLADKLNELPDMERRSYKKAIEAMNAWSENILATMNEVKMMN